MKRRLYYYGEDVLSKSFLILPKELVFTESLAKMSAKSKILYCVLRERLILSARNNWKDENGRIYLIYSIEKMAQDLFYSRATIMRMMDELENLGLIERRKQGLGKPNLVYLCNSETIAELLSGAYLLTSLYNAPDTMTFYYSWKVYEDLGYQPVSNFGNNDKSDPFRISEHRFFARSAERKQYVWR